MTQQETVKVCKQCGRSLPIDSFMKYKPRGNGIYKTTQGYHTICKECESVSSTLSNIQRRERDGKATEKDLANKQMLLEHYTKLSKLGYPPVTAAAKRLLGIEVVPRSRQSSLADKLQAMSMPAQRSADLHEASEAIRRRIESAEAAQASNVMDTSPAPVEAGHGDWSKELKEFVDAYRSGKYADDIDQADEDFKAVRSELYAKDPELADEIDEFCGF